MAASPTVERRDPDRRCPGLRQLWSAGVLVLLTFAGSGCTSGHPGERPDAGLDVGVCVGGSECRGGAFGGQPELEGPVPLDARRLFAGPSAREGACLVEPPDGAMLPNNWAPPRIRFIPLPGENLWEITLSTRSEDNDLFVYTTRTSWIMRAALWDKLRSSAAGDTIEISVRGIDSTAPGTPSLAQSSFQIAPVQANGTIAYWATTGPYGASGDTRLVRFEVGDTTTRDLLDVSDVNTKLLGPEADGDLGSRSLNEAGELWNDDFGEPGRVRCIGCHTSTPDGTAVAFVDSWPWNSRIVSIEPSELGARPANVGYAADRILQQPWQGAATFSKAYWNDEARLMLQSFGNGDGVGWSGQLDNVFDEHDERTSPDRLVWFDLGFETPDPLPESGQELDAMVRELEDTAFGFLARDGDTRAAVNPSWSHDGKTVAYVSASATRDGHAGGHPDAPEQEIETDVVLVPFNDGRGGTATRLEGASEPGIVEYYPDFSADDRLIAFTRAASNVGQVYYRPDGEIYVVPRAGGEATRLEANDPPACTGEQSPGLTNSWPKWSPRVEDDPEVDGRRYYWLTFSSARAYPGQRDLPRDEHSPAITPSSQLYIAAVVVDEAGEVTSYPALYLYNQTTDTTNLTPAWDEFQGLEDPE